MINLDGQYRKFYVNGRSNEMFLDKKVHLQSCAGIDGEIECGLHFAEDWRLDPGESISGEYVFKNITAADGAKISKLVLRYNEGALSTKPYFAIFTKIQ